MSGDAVSGRGRLWRRRLGVASTLLLAVIYACAAAGKLLAADTAFVTPRIVTAASAWYAPLLAMERALPWIEGVLAAALLARIGVVVAGCLSAAMSLGFLAYAAMLPDGVRCHCFGLLGGFGSRWLHLLVAATMVFASVVAALAVHGVRSGPVRGSARAGEGQVVHGRRGPPLRTAILLALGMLCFSAALWQVPGLAWNGDQEVAAPQRSTTRAPAFAALAVPVPEDTRSQDQEPCRHLASPVRALGADDVIGRVLRRDGTGLCGVAVILGRPGKWAALASPAAFSLEIEQVGEVVAREGTFFAGSTVRSAADGAFRFQAPIGAEPSCLAAFDPGIGYVMRAVPADARGPLDLILEPMGRITGTVVDELGNAIAGAVVQAYAPGNRMPVAECGTDERGVFATCRLGAGAYDLVAAEARHRTGQRAQVEISAAGSDEAVRLQLDLLPRFLLQLVDEGGSSWTGGRLEQATGFPAAALQFLASSDRHATRHDLELSARPSSRMDYDAGAGVLRGCSLEVPVRVLTLWHDADKLGEAAMSGQDGERVVLHVSGESLVTLDVTVACEFGVPPPDALVSVGVERTDGTLTLLGRQKLADGRARLRVPRVDTMSVVASARGFGLARSVLQAGAGPGELAATLHLARNEHRIAGRVVDATGRCIVQATIAVADIDKARWSVPVPRTTSDADGRFEITAADAPPWRLLAEASGMAPVALAIDGTSSEPSLIRMRPGRQVELHCPAGGIRLRMLDCHGGLVADDRLIGVVRQGARMHVQIDDSVATICALLADGSVIGPVQPVGDRLEFRR